MTKPNLSPKFLSTYNGWDFLKYLKQKNVNIDIGDNFGIVGDKTKSVTKILLTIFAGSFSGSKFVRLKSFSKYPWSLSLYVTNFFKMIGCSSATKLEKRTTLSNNSGSFSEYGSGLFSVL